MRTKRLRIDGGVMPGTYYHIFNRVAGSKADRPFDDVAKEHLVNLIHALGAVYTLDILGYTVMSNHYHIVLYAPHVLPSQEVAEMRWQLAHPNLPPPETADEWMIWRKRLRQISDFTKILQQKFTCWYNRTRTAGEEKRRGTLWAGRFKSPILEGESGNSAVWTCLKYIELNPVRANIVADPADYRFCSWGRCCSSGIHPFAAAFEFHLRQLRGHEADDWTAADTYAAMRSELARTIVADSGVSSGDIQAAAESAKRPPSIWLSADRRIRYWTDGAVIGSKAFVQQLYADHYGAERAARHRLGAGLDAVAGNRLFSMRRPQ